MALTTETGTNCLTQAEDAMAGALVASDQFRQWAAGHGETPLSEAEAAERVRIDQFDLPDDGMAFTQEEIEQRGSLVLVMADIEEGFGLRTGPGNQTISASGMVLVVFEEFTPEAAAAGINLERRMKNHLVTIMFEAYTHLLATRGDRWLAGLDMKQPPTALALPRHDRVVGHRLQSALALQFGREEG